METPHGGPSQRLATIKNGSVVGAIEALAANFSQAGLTANPVLRSLAVSSYLLIFLMGTSGNLLTLTVVLRNRTMHTVTNVFIANLAVSDVLMCAVAVPFTPLALFSDHWMLPDVFCRLLPMTMAVSVYVSSLTSLAIAIDRYFVIVHPFKPRMRLPRCHLILLAIWIIAVIASLPLGLYHKCQVDPTSTSNYTICMEMWPPNTNWKETFTVASFVMQFILPTLAISFCYCRIFYQLESRCKRHINRCKSSQGAKRSFAEIKRKRKTNKMLIAMVSIFIVCWIPLNALWIATDLIEIVKSHFSQTNYFIVVFLVCHIIAMSSTLYNPFLYGWMNENFRQEFCEIFGCLRWSLVNPAVFEQNSTFRRNSNNRHHQKKSKHERENIIELDNQFVEFEDDNISCNKNG